MRTEKRELIRERLHLQVNHLFCNAAVLRQEQSTYAFTLHFQRSF